MEKPHLPEDNGHRQDEKFKLNDESWRLRSDRSEQTQRGDNKAIALSAQMVRRYGLLYLILFFFPEQGKRTWIPDILRHYGWDGDPDTRNKYYNMLYITIRTLDYDFDVKLNLIRVDKNNKRYVGKKGYYQYIKIGSYGVFERNRLRKMLQANKDTFENIILNNSL